MSLLLLTLPPTAPFCLDGLPGDADVFDGALSELPLTKLVVSAIMVRSPRFDDRLG